MIEKIILINNISMKNYKKNIGRLGRLAACLRARERPLITFKKLASGKFLN